MKLIITGQSIFFQHVCDFYSLLKNALWNANDLFIGINQLVSQGDKFFRMFIAE